MLDIPILEKLQKFNLALSPILANKVHT